MWHNNTKRANKLLLYCYYLDRESWKSEIKNVIISIRESKFVLLYTSLSSSWNPHRRHRYRGNQNDSSWREATVYGRLFQIGTWGHHCATQITENSRDNQVEKTEIHDGQFELQKSVHWILRWLKIDVLKFGSSWLYAWQLWGFQRKS